MPPLIPLALAVVPELIRTIAGDRAGALAQEVAGTVEAVTGTDDPDEARRVLAADPSLAATLRLRLAEIALAGETARMEAALENTRAARGAFGELVRAGSPMAWGAPVVSVVVTVGFFVFLVVLMGGGIAAEGESQTVANIVNIAVGALATAFATVVNFWLGSSHGSRSKDEAVARALGR